MVKKGPIYYAAYVSSLWSRPWMDDDIIARMSQRAFDINPGLSIKTAVNYISKFPVLKYKRLKFRYDHGYASPRILIMSPNDGCQLSCSGCLTQKSRSKDVLSYEDMDSVVNQGRELGVQGIGLMGGEPLNGSSVDNVYKLLQTHKDMFFFIFTNAMNLQDRFIDNALKNSNTLFYLSSDGIGDISDQSRGADSFKYVKSAMERFNDHKIPYAMSFTVRSNNWEHLSELETIKYFEERGALLSLFFPYGPMDGVFKGSTRMTTKDERAEFLKRMSEVKKQKNMVFFDYANEIHFEGCRAGTGHFFVSAKGNVAPCFAMEGTMGNIKNVSIEEIIHSKKSDDIRTLHREVPHGCLINGAPKQLSEFATGLEKLIEAQSSEEYQKEYSLEI